MGAADPNDKFKKDTMLRIAEHEYKISLERIDCLANRFTKPLKPGARRGIVDTTAYNIKIRLTPNEEHLACAYALRRMHIAGKLMLLFHRLAEDQDRPFVKPKYWRWDIKGAVVQLTRSMGGEDHSRCAHTAPGQVVVDDQLPWVWTRNGALKQEFFRAFADTVNVPLKFNLLDSAIDGPPAGLDNKQLFLEYVKRAACCGSRRRVIASFADYCESLRVRLTEWQSSVAPNEYKIGLGNQLNLIQCYVFAIAHAPSLLETSLNNYADQKQL